MSERDNIVRDFDLCIIGIRKGENRLEKEFVKNW